MNLAMFPPAGEIRGMDYREVLGDTKGYYGATDDDQVWTNQRHEGKWTKLHLHQPASESAYYLISIRGKTYRCTRQSVLDNARYGTPFKTRTGRLVKPESRLKKKETAMNETTPAPAPAPAAAASTEPQRAIRSTRRYWIVVPSPVQDTYVNRADAIKRCENLAIDHPGTRVNVFALDTRMMCGTLTTEVAEEAQS